MRLSQAAVASFLTLTLTHPYPPPPSPPSLPPFPFPFPEYPDLTPPKAFFTPFFYLEVFSPNNRSLDNWWVSTPTYGSDLHITPNISERATFYQSSNWTNAQHPQGGPVLVRNVTDAVPYGTPGGPYTARNLIAGTSGCLTCDGSALPQEAQVFTKSQEQWDDFGSWELDFAIDEFSGGVRFNLTEGGALSGWTKTSACWFADAVSTRILFVVADRYFAQCSELHLRWVFAGF